MVELYETNNTVTIFNVTNTTTENEPTNNIIKNSIINNNKLEDKLNVIIVISNPCNYKKRYKLAHDFIKRIEKYEKYVELFIVELVYNNQEFKITNNNNKNHLQLRTDTAPLWHKENMINLGVKKLLPKDWKAFGWIDADIEFESLNWAEDTLKLLNGSYDIVQLFSHAVDMDENGLSLNNFSSFGYNYTKNNKYTTASKNNNHNYYHPGFGWACTREFYEKKGGIYELGILGSGDHLLSLSLLENGLDSIKYLQNDIRLQKYKESIYNYKNNYKDKVKIGYVPTVIRHYYHGTKKNRQYIERTEILKKHNYDPFLYLTKNDDGLLIPTNDCPLDLLNNIMQYFKDRNEDEI